MAILQATGTVLTKVMVQAVVIAKVDIERDADDSGGGDDGRHETIGGGDVLPVYCTISRPETAANVMCAQPQNERHTQSWIAFWPADW